MPAIADWCAVDLLDDAGRLKRLAVAHRDPARIRLVEEIERRYPEPADSPTGSYSRVREGRTDWVRLIPDEMLEAAAQSPEHLDMIRQLGLRSFISVPLRHDARVIGLFTVVTSESGRLYKEEDVKLVRELARRASTAVAHARAHQTVIETADRFEEQAIELEVSSEQLREAEQFARNMIEAIADPVIVYDPAFRVRYENGAAVAVFMAGGERTSAMLGRTLWEEYPDLIGTTFETEMRRAMESRTPTNFVEQRRSTWTEVRCYPLPDGGLVVVWRDITAARRAEQAGYYLSRATEVLATSLDYEQTVNALAELVVPELADWVSINLVEGDRLRLVAAAHADAEKVALARELSLRSPITLDSRTRAAEVVRTGKSDLVPLLTDEMIERAFDDQKYRSLLKSFGPSSILTVPVSIGNRVLGAVTLIGRTRGSQPRFSEADTALAEEIARRAAIAIDNARLYQEAVAARAEAELANSTKMAFLARMSHELRTPLNAIAGYADLLLMGVRGDLTAPQLADVERIKRSQHHLLSLINDLLNFAKIEAGRLEYDVRNVPLAAALAAIEPIFAQQLAEKKLRYTLTNVAVTLEVKADADRLNQVLINLLSNAIKFTPNGGAIGVEAIHDASDALVSVLNTGPEIPDDKLEAIFEPFVQLPQAGEMARGTGLGLAISRDLARGMGGDLVALSTQNGARFLLRLPLA